MAHIEIAATAFVEAPADIDAIFELGMKYSSGHDVTIDMVSAHKWFNIAAARGHQDGARLRREVAQQMTDSEIGLAQRAARDWLKANPETVKPAAIRAAA